jgi:hypothetical protein
MNNHIKLTVIAVFLVGCNQLIKGQEQPVVSTDIKQGIYSVTCAGAVEHWGSCFRKANQKCEQGYKALNQNENSTGTKRELTFQCNK